MRRDNKQKTTKNKQKENIMINFKKGPALSLHQVNYVGKPAAGENIEAGMVVRFDTASGTWKKGASANPAPINVEYGFAINSQDSGDVIEAGAIGVYALDGASVIETDKFTGVIGDYAVGAPVSVGTDGKIKTLTVTNNAVTTTDKVIGYVEGSRELPGRAASTTIDGRTFTYPSNTTVLGIKLAV
jgi:hypothetical protein